MAEQEFDTGLITNMSERSETFRHVFDREWKSPVFLAFLKEMDLASRHDEGILILGPTGSGKSTVARCIHELRSHRRRHEEPTRPEITGLEGSDSKSKELRRDYLALFEQIRSQWKKGSPIQHLNLGGMSMTLAQAELFGHTPGAFTEAKRLRPGAILSAHGGTLFLDEVADANAVTQKALLDFLDNGCFKPEGGDFDIHVRVGVIAATNKDPIQEIEGGSFRDDLYFRLANHILMMPALIDRMDDFELLAEGLLARQVSAYSRRDEFKATSFSDGVLKQLKGFGKKWTGNIRQLEFVINNAFCRASDSPEIKVEHLPDARTLYHQTRLVDRQNPTAVIDHWLPTVDFEVLKDRYVRVLNDEYRGNIDLMSDRSGISRSSFYRWRKEGKLRAFEGKGGQTPPHDT
ncbi:MAG: sigma 54-interacting transcriptional regulator [Pseudomonadota bacterium]